MKHAMIAVLGSMLFAAPMAYANHSTEMMARLAQASAGSKEVSLQRKASGCEQNAKNLSLQGEKLANYMKACMTENPAQAAYASAHGGICHRPKPGRARRAPPRGASPIYIVSPIVRAPRGR